MTGIRRRFFDLGNRQLHYRIKVADAGEAALPLVALHHLPGSARQIEPVIRALDGRTVIAPDLAGTGDSDLHPEPAPGMSDYATDAIALIRGLGLAIVDLYGSHTGACLAVEIALREPALVRRIVLDGVPIYSAEEAAELATNYAPIVPPDVNGLHLLWAHNFCRDQILFWPWYDRTAGSARGTGLPPARALHEWVLEVIKGLEGFPLGYRAVFAYPMAERLRHVSQPTLCISAVADTLAATSRRAVSLLADGHLAVIDDRGQAMAPPKKVAAEILDFLDPSGAPDARWADADEKR